MSTSPTIPATPGKAGRNLPAAIAVGVGLFAAIAVGLFLAPWAFVLLVAAALCIGVIEVHQALSRKGMHAAVVPIVIGTAVSVTGGYVVAQWDFGIRPTTFIVICIGATVIACLAARLRGGAEGFLRDIAASALLIAYIPLMGVFIALLMGDSQGSLRILAVVLCVVSADTGAYAVGSLFGRHKLAPTISPSKTWEGLVGSLVIASAGGVGVAIWLLHIPWWVGLVLGVCCALAATMGDLVESLIKRDAGIKDMSNFLPGHGGIMDRLDSMLVAVPIGWVVLHLTMGA